MRALGRRNTLIGAGSVVGVLVLGVVLVFALGGGTSSSASTPREAVKKFLDAGKANDRTRAKKLLCKKDQTSSLIDDVASGGRITSYTLGEEKTINNQRVVVATYTDKDGTQSVPFPVIQEGSNWRVCLSDIAATLGVPSTFPTPSTSGGSTGSGSTLPSGSATNSFSGAALCAGAANGYQAATTYVGAALAGQASLAQSCVYGHSVPLSITTYLKGKFFVPSTADDKATDIPFASTDGTSRITVHTKKEPDGHWYVVDVTTG